MQSQRRQSGEVKTPIRRICEKVRELTKSAVVLLLMVLISSASVYAEGEANMGVASSDPTFKDSVASKMHDLAEAVKLISPRDTALSNRFDSLVAVIRASSRRPFPTTPSDTVIEGIRQQVNKIPTTGLDKTTLDQLDSKLKAYIQVLEAYEGVSRGMADDGAQTKFELVRGVYYLFGGLILWLIIRDLISRTDPKRKKIKAILGILQYLAPLFSAGAIVNTIEHIEFSPTIQPVVWQIHSNTGDQRVIVEDSVLYVKLDALTTKVDSILNTRPGKVVESLHGKLDSIMRVDPNMVDSSLHEKVDSLFHHDFSCIDPSLRGLLKDVMDKIEAKCGGSNLGSTKIEQLPTVGSFPTNVYTIERGKPLYSTYHNLVDSLRLKVLKEGHELVTLMLIGNADMRPPRGTIGSQAVPNSELAQRRAESVKRHLLNESILEDTARIVTLNSSLTAIGSKAIWPGETYPPPDWVMSKNRSVQVIAVWKKKS